MIARLPCLASVVAVLVGGCYDRSETADRVISEDFEKQRALHAQVLDLQPGIEDLPEELRGVANVCWIDESHDLCPWGRENLSEEDWARIGAAWAEEDRRAAERDRMLAACRDGDEEALKSMYPGRFAFYQMVRSPPEYLEAPADAVASIGISSTTRGRAQRVVRDGMANEGLQVPYGGPRLRDFLPNKYSERSNTERFFRGFYTPAIEARMEEIRPECERLRNTAFIQAACRRDVGVSIVRDWMEARGHRSVRLIVAGQSSWPEYQLLIEEYLPGLDARIDTGSFSSTLRRDSSFLFEICAMGLDPELWLDYEFYVRRLFPEG